MHKLPFVGNSAQKASSPLSYRSQAVATPWDWEMDRHVSPPCIVYVLPVQFLVGFVGMGLGVRGLE